jgi:hypothetical protein
MGGAGRLGRWVGGGGGGSKEQTVQLCVTPVKSRLSRFQTLRRQWRSSFNGAKVTVIRRPTVN